MGSSVAVGWVFAFRLLSHRRSFFHIVSLYAQWPYFNLPRSRIKGYGTQKKRPENIDGIPVSWSELNWTELDNADLAKQELSIPETNGNKKKTCETQEMGICADSYENRANSIQRYMRLWVSVLFAYCTMRNEAIGTFQQLVVDSRNLRKQCTSASKTL